jgi:hypothetical protein
MRTDFRRSASCELLVRHAEAGAWTASLRSESVAVCRFGIGYSQVLAILGSMIFAASPNFVPDYVFKRSALTGWRKLGQVEWRAENGEIIGVPKENGGGWCWRRATRISVSTSRMGRKFDSCLATPIGVGDGTRPSRRRSVLSSVGVCSFQIVQEHRWCPDSCVRASLSALAAELVLQSQSAGMSQGLHGSGSSPVIVVQHAA